MNLFKKFLLSFAVLICFLLASCASKKPKVLEVTKITNDKMVNEKARVDKLAKAAECVENAKAAEEKAKQAIHKKVNSRWVRPPGSENLKCVIRIRLAEDGSVLSTGIVRSSGDEVFDSSVENTVKSASPLPVPIDKEVFICGNFRSITISFSHF